MKIKTTYRQIRDDFSLKNNELYKQIADMEPVSVANTIPLTWAKAVDFSVWDDKGNKFIDLTSGIFVANAGHSNPKIKKAIKDQVDADVLFAYNYPTKIKYQFLKKLLAASRHFDCATLLNSGSEAVAQSEKIVNL
jgi:4-aminobutyrate aminotransferase-like enzyme